MESLQPSPNWQAIYQSEILSRRRRQKHFSKLCKAGVLRLSRASRILDMACGQGEMLDLLTLEGFSNLTGLDLNASLETGNKPWCYVPGSVTQLPFEDQEFDAVICAHALHHLSISAHIEKALSEALRCLRPGGRLFLIDHYDSIQLRIVFALLRLPLPKIFLWATTFRQQLCEEHQELYHYLDHWQEVYGILKRLPCFPVQWKRGAFFFYYDGEKKS